MISSCRFEGKSSMKIMALILALLALALVTGTAMVVSCVCGYGDDWGTDT